jgi:transposase InsO family protein
MSEAQLKTTLIHELPDSTEEWRIFKAMLKGGSHSFDELREKIQVHVSCMVDPEFKKTMARMPVALTTKARSKKWCGHCKSKTHNTIDCRKRGSSSSNGSTCTHCKKTHPGGEASCWMKHPELRPAKRQKQAGATAAVSFDNKPTEICCKTDLEKFNKDLTKMEDQIFQQQWTNFLDYDDEEEGKKNQDHRDLRERNKSNESYSLSSIAGRKPAVFETSLSKGDQWIIDTGCTHHMTGYRHVFSDLKPMERPVVVSLGDKSRLAAVGKGTVRIQTDPHTILVLHDVYLVPNLKFSLISPYMLSAYDLKMTVSLKGAELSKFGQTIVRIPFEDDLLIIRNMISYEKTLIHKANSSAYLSNMYNWHQRLGHLGVATLNRIILSGDHKEIGKSPIYQNEPLPKCSTCMQCKFVRPKFFRATRSTSRPLELVHSDVLYINASENSSSYVVIFLDDFTGYLYLSCINKKSQVFAEFVKFHRWAEQQTGLKLRTLRNDKGGEYVSNEFKDYLTNHGIESEESCTAVPEQNGKAERMNRHMLGMVRSMIYHSGLPHNVWPEMMTYASYIYNRVPTHRFPKSCPEHDFLQRPSTLSSCRVIGCAAYVRALDPNNKIDPNANLM